MRVLVTRAAEDQARTAAALAERGHEALGAPVIRIVRLAPRYPAARPKALVATSHQAFGPDLPADWRPGLPVFAVGARTAETARAAGFEDVRVGTGNGEALAPLLLLTLPRPGPLLYLAGRDRKPGLEGAVAAAGFRLDTVETYAATPAEHWPADIGEALRAGTVTAALHFSRRSAELALALAESETLGAAFIALRHLCLSADVATPLLAAGATDVAIAEAPDERHLLALVPRSPLP